MDQARRVAVWLAPEQVPLVQQVARVAELTLVAAGSPARGQSGAVAGTLESKPFDDLRAMLATAPADLVWIASPDSFGAGSSQDDAMALQAAHARGVKIATLEPIPARALDLVSGGWTSTDDGARPVDVIRLCPLTRLSAPFREAADVIESFGHIRTVSVEAWCRPSEGSLGARMYGALELILALMGEPETIDAAFVSPTHGRGVHALPGESFRDLHGDLTANMRFADGRSAGVVASDQGGRWNRTATFLGPGGRFRVFDDGFEWIGPDGAKVDESRPVDRTRGKEPQLSHAVAAIADSLQRMLDVSVPDPGPADHATILAMGQAALLSARTGQAESPATIKHMVGA